MPVLTYQYEPYQSRHTANIAELIMRPGEARARGLQQAAETQAAAQRANANTWGQAIQGVGQAVQNAPATIHQYQQLSDNNAVRDAMKLGAQGRDAVLDVLQKTAPHMVPAVAKQYDDMDASAANVLKKHGEVQEMNREYIASVAAKVAENGYDLHAAGLGLQHIRNTAEQRKDRDLLREVDGIAQQLSENPDSIKTIIDGAIQLSPERAKQFELAKYHGVQAQQDTRDYELKKQIADWQAEYRRETLKVSQMREGREIAQAALNEKHRQKMEDFKAKELALEGRSVSVREKALDQTEVAPELTDEALEIKAQQWAQGDPTALTGLGMGKAGAKLRTEIMNRGAAIYGNFDLASQHAAYKANVQSYGKMQQQRDALGAFEETGLKNLDVFLDTSKKILDTGSPFLNTPIRDMAGKVFGSTDQTAYETARRVVIPELAKILTNPNLAGQLSDSARHEVEEVVNGNATGKQVITAVNILKTDMANRIGALDEGLTAIKGRIAQPPKGTKAGETPPATTPTSPPAGAPVFERGPDGKIRKKG